jgi:hypothetical protein
MEDDVPELLTNPEILQVHREGLEVRLPADGHVRPGVEQRDKPRRSPRTQGGGGSRTLAFRLTKEGKGKV